MPPSHQRMRMWLAAASELLVAGKLAEGERPLTDIDVKELTKTPYSKRPVRPACCAHK